MKKLAIFIFIFIMLLGSIIATSILWQPDITSATIQQNKNKVYHIKESLNEDSMDIIDKKFIQNTKSKYAIESKELSARKNKVELTVNLSEEKEESIGISGKINGSIRIDKRSFGFKGQGEFVPFKSPDTGETIYFGHASGELKGVKMNKLEPNYKEYDGNNSLWIIIYNPTKDEAYISAGVGFEGYTGVLIYGNRKLASNEYKDAYMEAVKLKERQLENRD